MNIQNNDWLVVRYKPNQLKRVEDNLSNQDLTFYTPKVNKIDFKKDQNKKVVLFPGYGFIKNGFNRIHSIKYTKGILSILKFGSKYAFMHDEKIKEFLKAEKLSEKEPFKDSLVPGDEIIIEEGPFKGHITKIISLSSNDRINIMMKILGTFKKIQVIRSVIKKL